MAIVGGPYSIMKFKKSQQSVRHICHKAAIVCFISCVSLATMDGIMADDVCYGKRLLEIIAPEKTSLPDQESPDYGGLIFDGNFSDIKKLRHERQLEDAHETVRSLYLRSVDLYGQESDRYAPYSDNDGQDPPLNHGEQYNLDLDCRRPAWVKESFPTCNQVHEELLIERPFDSQMIFQDYIVSYLSSGDFRDAWKFQRYDADAENNSVLKRMKLADQFSWGQGGRDLFRIRQEAIILEKLTASPRIINIYGFCGTSVIMEAMASDLTKQLVKGNGIASQEMLNRLDDADISLNNFTASEKLQISLDMAMSLADLHGFKGGPICHADGDIQQFLVARDGSVRLQDFNVARVPAWNEKTLEYCDSWGWYDGPYRSPEELEEDLFLDENTDTFAFGNNVYVLLTGLWPFYDEMHKRKVDIGVIEEDICFGKRGFVDPRFRKRSYIEGKLVEIMERCWEQEQLDRPSIFEVVKFLQEVKDNARKSRDLVPSKRIRIP